jgi:phosphonate transport system substrate-binding protein
MTKFIPCLLLFALVWSRTACAEAVYTISIVPQVSPLLVYKHWKPLVDHLSRQTHSTFIIQVQNSIPEFEATLVKGKPDFAFMNPYHLIMARKHQHYIPLVRSGARDLRGILVTRKDRGINDISQLNGKTLVFPSPNAFGASLYMRALLTNEFNISFQEKYVTTHANVYRHVVRGQAVAGGGVLRTLSVEQPSIKDKLKILYKTPGVAPHPLCAHERVPEHIRQQVANTILQLGEAASHADNMLLAIHLHQPVRADYNRDYEYLNTMNLEQFTRFSTTGAIEEADESAATPDRVTH